MVMLNYRNCDFCGELFKDQQLQKPELCWLCWYIPSHIPIEQHETFYRLRKNEKSKHKIYRIPKVGGGKEH